MDCPDTSPVRLQRLLRRSQFLYVRDGHVQRRKSLIVQARPRSDESLHTGVGYTATKRVGGAVLRNRARRRLREAARLLLPLHGRAGWDYVFISRDVTPGIGWGRLLDDMESALISLPAR